MRSLYFSLIILGTLSIACGPQKDQAYAPTSRNFFDPLFGSNRYAKVFERWTKRDRTQSEFDLTMLVDATFWSDEIRRAYVDEATDKYMLGEEESKTLAYSEQQESESHFVFIISATSRDQRWNDFDKRTSIWRLVLENPRSGKRVGSQRIEKVNFKNERARYFYQRMNRFNETYKVYFPKAELRDSQELVLYITGPRGALDFRFHVPPDLQNISGSTSLAK